MLKILVYSKYLSDINGFTVTVIENPLTANFDRNGSYSGTSKEGEGGLIPAYNCTYRTISLLKLDVWSSMDLRKSAHENIKLSVYLQI